MAEYSNVNRGALWKNEKRETDKHPNLTGSLNVEGKDYWVSGWTSKEGGKKPLVSFSIKSKDSQRAPNPKPVEDDFDDSLPF